MEAVIVIVIVIILAWPALRTWQFVLSKRRKEDPGSAFGQRFGSDDRR